MGTNSNFQETCEVFDLRTCSDTQVLNERFIDPCSCLNYYQCSNNYELIRQTCAEGTAWDHDTNVCIHYKDVTYKHPCNEETNVWTRCNTTESRLEELKYICTNETRTTVTTPQSTTLSNANKTDKINPGIIIGSIIGGAVIAVIVLVAAFVLYRRRKKRNSINKNRGRSTHNPEYFEGGYPDDPYAVIHDHQVTTDSSMADPTYNGGTTNQQNGSCTNAEFDGLEDAVYDNSVGERIVGSGYTNTLRRSIREYETPAGASSSRVMEIGNHVTESVAIAEREGNLYVDLNGNENKSSDENQSEMVGSDVSSVEPGAAEFTKGHTNEDMPDYFVLEKSCM